MKDLTLYGTSEQQYPAYIVRPNPYSDTIVTIILPNGNPLAVQGWAFKLAPKELAENVSQLMNFKPGDDFDWISAGLVETRLPISKIISRGVLTLRNGTYLITRTDNGQI